MHCKERRIIKTVAFFYNFAFILQPWTLYLTCLTHNISAISSMTYVEPSLTQYTLSKGTSVYKKQGQLGC